MGLHIAHLKLPSALLELLNVSSTKNELVETPIKSSSKSLGLMTSRLWGKFNLLRTMVEFLTICISTSLVLSSISTTRAS